MLQNLTNENSTLVQVIETVSPEGTFCETVQVPPGAADMQLI